MTTSYKTKLTKVSLFKSTHQVTWQTTKTSKWSEKVHWWLGMNIWMSSLKVFLSRLTIIMLMVLGMVVVAVFNTMRPCSIRKESPQTAYIKVTKGNRSNQHQWSSTFKQQICLKSKSNQDSRTIKMQAVMSIVAMFCQTISLSWMMQQRLRRQML